MSAYYKSHYDDPVHAALLSLEAVRWQGTPFRFASQTPGPGGGVDCVGLCAAVHVACGVCAPFEIDRRPLHWSLHHEESGILEFFREPIVRARLRQLDPEDEPAHGDLIAVKTYLAIHHLGTFIDDALGRHLLHVPINGTVRRTPLGDRMLRGRVAGLWRITPAPSQP